MSPDSAIRPGEARDAKRLSVLATQVWLHTYATDGVSDEMADYLLAEHTPARFQALLTDPSRRVIVAGQESRLTGFAVVKLAEPCHDAEGATTELQQLYVQEHFIGQGIGKALLTQAEAIAREQADGLLWLMVNAENSRAIRFYAHLGYRKVGTAFFVLGTGRHENHVLVGRGP